MIRRRGRAIYDPKRNTDIGDLRNAYKLIYKSGATLEEAKAALAKEEADSPNSADYLRMMREFLDNTTRGIVR